MSDTEKLDAIMGMLTAILQALPKPVATDDEMNGSRGDPEMKMAPKKFPSIKGKRMSQLSAEELDGVANLYDFFAEKNAGTDAKKAGWDREGARLARGWAKRKRAGWKPAKDSNAALFEGDDAPF